METTHSENQRDNANSASAVSTQGMFASGQNQAQALQLRVDPILIQLLFNIFRELKIKNDLEIEKRKQEALSKEQEQAEQEEDARRFEQVAPSLYI